MKLKSKICNIFNFQFSIFNCWLLSMNWKLKIGNWKYDRCGISISIFNFQVLALVHELNIENWNLKSTIYSIFNFKFSIFNSWTDANKLKLKIENWTYYRFGISIWTSLFNYWLLSMTWQLKLEHWNLKSIVFSIFNLQFMDESQ